MPRNILYPDREMCFSAFEVIVNRIKYEADGVCRGLDRLLVSKALHLGISRNSNLSSPDLGGATPGVGPQGVKSRILVGCETYIVSDAGGTNVRNIELKRDCVRLAREPDEPWTQIL